MNIIAPPKRGKSWLVTDLAIAVASGRSWMEVFAVERGNVLVLDNELHGETIRHRILKVAVSRGISLGEFDERLCVESLRGRLVDILELADYFATIPKRRFNLIILDALYRFMPRGFDENDNGAMAQVYNAIDRYADTLGCSFALVHHSSKGNQSGKSVTDVGSGAGSQSRATDSHLVLRDHEDPDTVVVDAAVRSFEPIAARCIRWAFPVWTSAAGSDPGKLKGDRKKKAPPRSWDAETFTEAFITPEPQSMKAILLKVKSYGEHKPTQRDSKALLESAVSKKLAYKYAHKNPSEPLRFSTEPPLKMGTAG